MPQSVDCVEQEDDGTAPTDLYGVEVTVVDRDECAADYADVEDATIDSTMVCAGVPEGGKDSCSVKQNFVVDAVFLLWCC